MSSIEAKKAIYREARQRTGLNKRQWGRLFALGSLNNTDQVVGHKENPESPGPGSTSKGVNKAEALSAQLLAFLHDEGYDLTGITFDDEGRLQEIPREGEQ